MFEPLKNIQPDTDFKAGQLILIDKPKGVTSFKVVKDIRYRIKKNFRIREKLKVGHAGTLDPLATGLLIICTGRMTKKIPELQGGMKTYTGIFQFGATTPSFDLETEIDETFSTSAITAERVQDAFRAFTGKISQVPPIYSAVKVKGRRAYDMAREEQQVELKPKAVEIFEFNLLSLESNQAVFHVKCSKGTYIRSLARDIGRYLDSGAYLKELCRTESGPFRVTDAFTPEAFIAKLEQSEQQQALNE